MPCRYCRAERPSKGFVEPGEQNINALLKEAARLILEKREYGFDDIEEWKNAWQEAFDHHLNGCKNKT